MKSMGLVGFRPVTSPTSVVVPVLRSKCDRVVHARKTVRILVRNTELPVAAGDLRDR